MEFFTQLEYLLNLQKPQEKCRGFKEFYKAYQANELSFNHAHEAIVFKEPSYVGFCELVSPTVVLKRRKLNTTRGKVVFLHAVAHIEYSAIDLAMDAAYRFKNLPKKYYDDFLSIAFDEVRHFEMLDALLVSLGSYYSELPVHDSLFESCMRTLTLIERMAVVPRYLEANGLDATPMMITKLKQLDNDKEALDIIEALEVILEEECDHVYKGDVWFKYACDEQKQEYDCYFDIIEQYYPGSFPRKKNLNVSARQLAGFSCSELKKMNTQVQCKS